MSWAQVCLREIETRTALLQSLSIIVFSFILDPIRAIIDTLVFIITFLCSFELLPFDHETCLIALLRNASLLDLSPGGCIQSPRIGSLFQFKLFPRLMELNPALVTTLDQRTFASKSFVLQRATKNLSGGSVVTHFGAPSLLQECVSQFRYLITQDTGSSISQTKVALYEISTESEDDTPVNEKRAKPTKDTKTKAKSTTAKTRKAKPTAVKTTTLKAVRITSKLSSIKPTGSKTSSRASGSATPSASACPLPRKGKNGKPIQRRCAGDQFYMKKDLLVGKVTHWKFNTMGDVGTYNADANAKLVLKTMRGKGQLDVA